MADYEAPAWSQFSGLNEAYLQDLFDLFRANPDAVDPETRSFFERHGQPPIALAPAPRFDVPDRADAPLLVAGAVALATAIRAHGHRAARLDPLRSLPPGDDHLQPEAHGIRETDLAALPASIIGGPVGETSRNASEAIQRLRQLYEGPIGYEFEHVSDAEERAWLREAVESGRFCPPSDPIDPVKLLERLSDVGAFEKFLHQAFQGQTRFSLEGLGMMVPMLDEILGAAAECGTRVAFLGMAHRGRLNVLAHTLGKPYEQIIAEFMGIYQRSNISPSGSSDEGWTGDVKYHMGARKAYRGGAEVDMQIVMVPNPSHLEWVNPVVLGMDRASDEDRSQPGPAHQDELASLSILIHGDASFPGQGIVAETLNLSRLPGYRIGGTIHLIANNQLGFTTPANRGRSTLYSSDLAKGFEIPVIHVNADDPEACILASRLAHAYRERFRKDALIDLVGYRRYGHNEGDEPTFTHPVLYRAIGEHPTVRQLWATELQKRGLVSEEQAKQMLAERIDRLREIRQQLQAKLPDKRSDTTTSGFEAGGAFGGLGRPGVAATVETALPPETLAGVNQELYTLPEAFHLHPKLEKTFTRRREVFALSGGSQAGAEEQRVEWAHGEALAFGSLLAEGTPIRLTGQDVSRGTFSHRHAKLFDYETSAAYVPLQHIPSARVSFEVWDSPLSEQATLGFEFGYSLQASEALVLWEAQYGDFVNVPQAIIDQFIVSARSKWDQYSGLVLLLPHGYEGQGPEHSSARLERFLQLAAEDNLRIANCTTSAQYFHILRRQARLLSLDPRPLVMMMPKSLLRHPAAASPAREFTAGGFQPVLRDEVAPDEAEGVRRLILCSGKVYYDLVAGGQLAGHATGDGGSRSGSPVAAARIEELYPFPAQQVSRVIESYPRLEEVIWLQEEPRNMGAWTFVAPRLRDLLRNRLPLRYIGRTRRASPSEGSHEWHVREQARIIEAAFNYGPTSVDPSLNPEVEHVG